MTHPTSWGQLSTGKSAPLRRRAGAHGALSRDRDTALFLPDAVTKVARERESFFGNESRAVTPLHFRLYWEKVNEFPVKENHFLLFELTSSHRPPRAGTQRYSVPLLFS